VKALVWVLGTGLAAAVAEPPMPSWRAEDRKAMESGELVPGLLLLSEEPPSEEAGGAGVPEPAAGEIAASEPVAPEVPEAYLNAYFGERPTGFLVDPQGLLGTKDARDRESFLSYHAGDSEVDLFVYVFDGHQAIPAEVREEEVVERFFAEGKPAVVVYYYLGAPQKSDIHVSPRLSEVVSSAEQRRALISSVEEALEKPDALAQFEAFCVQLSIRIYWMERAAGLVKNAPAVPLPRVAKAAAPEKKEDSPALLRAKQWGGLYGVPCAIVGGALLVAAGGLSVARRRAKFHFPVFEVPPRLGGSHAAGIGAVISFGSTTQSPSAQRNEVPDYLGL
jgi:hypothetical protein